MTADDISVFLIVEKKTENNIGNHSVCIHIFHFVRIFVSYTLTTEECYKLFANLLQYILLQSILHNFEY